MTNANNSNGSNVDFNYALAPYVEEYGYALGKRLWILDNELSWGTHTLSEYRAMKREALEAYGK